ncbi:hypothetical protein [Acrocarpospora sp. B8E8]|uniref:hypothetical protein n=1 Tax=Acrocarpospora sp. B8E8 TaxID=3153572 RepID=UPI00325E7FA8
MSFPTVIPYLLGGFGPVIGAIVIRARRARLRQSVPAHTVRLRLGTRLFWVPLLLVLAPATVLAGALLAHLLGDPAVSLTAVSSPLTQALILAVQSIVVIALLAWQRDSRAEPRVHTAPPVHQVIK